MMTASDLAAPHGSGQKPRLVLMGEFSSGKSTLSNILLGGPTLPTQVTATRLPPVHISYGEPGAFAIARDGTRRDVDVSNLGDISPDEIQSLHLTMESDTLELCDLIDMPGISDPNMPIDTWDAVVRPSDHVIWCTHATQAWRQSEAAMWDRMRDATSGSNLLLITQFDKLRNSRDCNRVLSRVAAETDGKFTAVYPVSLLAALAAGDDVDAWRESGANVFMEHLVEILLKPSDQPDAKEAAEQDENVHIAEPVFDASVNAECALPDTSDHDVPHAGNRITPRRVQAKSGSSHQPRPARPAKADGNVWVLESGAI